MDAQAKKLQLVQQLINFFENDKYRLKRLGDGLKVVGIDTNDSATLDRIAEYPEYFTTLISYAELGIFEKLIESVNKIKGT